METFKFIIHGVLLLSYSFLVYSHELDVQEIQAEGITIELEVDFGQDMGQNFGTLFEARDPTGRLSFGAGFPASYNTYYQSDRYQLQFFVRPEKAEKAYSITPFLRPSNNLASNYLYSQQNKLSIGYESRNHLIYDDNSEQWVEEKNKSGQYANGLQIRGKNLEFTNQQLRYDGRLIWDTSQGQYKNYQYHILYYAQGAVFFYRIRSDGKEMPGLLAVPYSPYEAVIDPTKAIVLKLWLNEFPYSWGQFNNEVITCSNYGGCYAFNGKAWKDLKSPSKETSFQIYSMITYNDQLLMGEYPHGFLLEYDGKNIITHPNWPPVPSNASPFARELQTTVIYRGELFAGVWPWAELWRLSPDSTKWLTMGRLFSSPNVSENPIHPYETEASASGSVFNQLGQRLTSMVAHKDSLLMGTSWKIGETIIDEYKFSLLNREQRMEYGAIHRLKMSGNLTGLLTWKDHPTKLLFMAKNGEMAIFQDGEKIASTEFDTTTIKDMQEYNIKFGHGVFGKFNGPIKQVN